MWVILQELFKERNLGLLKEVERKESGLQIIADNNERERERGGGVTVLQEGRGVSGGAFCETNLEKN